MAVDRATVLVLQRAEKASVRSRQTIDFWTRKFDGLFELVSELYSALVDADNRWKRKSIAAVDRALATTDFVSDQRSVHVAIDKFMSSTQWSARHHGALPSYLDSLHTYSYNGVLTEGGNNSNNPINTSASSAVLSGGDYLSNVSSAMAASSVASSSSLVFRPSSAPVAFGRRAPHPKPPVFPPPSTEGEGTTAASSQWPVSSHEEEEAEEDGEGRGDYDEKHNGVLPVESQTADLTECAFCRRIFFTRGEHCHVLDPCCYVEIPQFMCTLSRALNGTPSYLYTIPLFMSDPMFSSC